MSGLVPLGEACELVTDGTHFTPTNVGKGLPFLTVKDVSDSGLDFVNCSFISDDDYQAAREGNSAPQRGDVLFSKDGTVGKVHVVTTDRPFAVLSSLAILRPIHGEVDAAYLGHALRSPQVLDDALRKKTGSAIRRIVLADLKRVNVPLPSLPEQRRIAEVLDRAEALRAKRRAALAHLDTLTQSIFLDIFGGAGGSEMGWPLSELGALCERVIDCPHSTPVYADGPTKYPCVRTSDIQNGELVLSTTKYVEKAEYDVRVARGRPCAGDVIYCREGARFGNAARLPSGVSICLGQRMMLFRAREDLAVGEYLWAFLLSGPGLRQAMGAVAGSASPHVNIEDLIAFRVPRPPLPLQREFARRVRVVDKMKAVERRCLEETESLFSALQHRAFRGQL